MAITYLEAIREAQAKALADDDSVYIYGQDVAGFGGAFKATKNLAERFPGRVIDAPISEDAMVGSAIGAAIEGMRPIVEMQFADFSSIAFNQIVNQAATHFFRTGVPCPIVVRLPSGGTEGSGPFHSQNLESIYSHYPGLVVMTPATVEDAYSMLLEAVAINDPVIFCEHKFLYYHLKADALPTTPMLPAGRARIVKQGRHATVVTYSAMVHESLKAARELKAEGWDIEVVDLRTVKPIDTDTVLGSVARTGRLLCVSEGFPWGGVTAEVVSRVVADGFHLLDAPPQRLNCRDTPIPYHPNLWKAHRPTSQNIAESLRALLHL
ncbi:MAG: alpha-ketoacid dehydrogenase subunit beta [Verrucomicrobiales bacterium]|jgi:pyruvate/2-oxoglutarate/acetoin dehydrogenase E1 component|nr:alpha-ketoacid dehydrogenase subunit beta [Verrucomicrobiales bacterium]MBP9225055.1 alpha-ketoacid dehydrogenase subunit beta [Verrucomicrobiales bacterium]HQZ28557.1 transketolase C-terminal domain-containing protein [Verrucomicrobiales bacterium]